MADFRFSRLVAGVLVAGWVVLATASALADLMPHYSIVQMSGRADLIVEGTADAEGDGFTLSAVHHDPSGTLKPGDRITVTHLSSHSRGPNHPAANERLPDTTRQAVLFLLWDKVGRQYTPISSYADPEKGGGSRGLLWWDQEKCYGYSQISNPGPYALVPGEQSHRVADIAALREAIGQGLELARAWDEIQAIESDVERAAAIAAAWQSRSAINQLFSLRIELREIGEPAIAPLIAILQDADESTNLNDVVLTLYDIGRKQPEQVARATDILIERLESPGRTSAYYILSAMTSARDPASIPAVRAAINNDQLDLQARTQAAEALAAMGDVESFASIEAVLDEVIAMPREPGDTNTGYSFAVDLLNALHQLDPERAKAAIAKVGKTPGISNATSHVRNNP